jgi:hypothetical protein
VFAVGDEAATDDPNFDCLHFYSPYKAVIVFLRFLMYIDFQLFRVILHIPDHRYYWSLYHFLLFNTFAKNE